jgi:hypothetical protein
MASSGHKTAHATPTTDDVLQKAKAQAQQAGVSAEVASVLAAAPGSLRNASPRQMVSLQRAIGNSALQRLLAPTAVEAPHAPACTCPHCKPQRVYTDEPLAPALQREADAHGVGCTCPACTSGVETAAAPALQRWWGEEEEAETEAGEGSALEQAQDNAGDSGGAEGAQESDSDSTGEVMTVQEDYVGDETGGKPDLGLHVAVVEGGGNPAEEAGPPVGAPPTMRFIDAGRVGSAPVSISSHLPDDGQPHAFVDGGMTGTVIWAGGGGAGPRGEQGTGTIQTTVNPTYQSRSNGLFSDSEAWVLGGTGDLTVKRSWLGANGGDQGNGHYVTPAAAARFNAHEVLHVNSTKSIYDAHIKPMLERVVAHRDDNPGHSTVHAFLQSSAIEALRSTIGWADAVSAFQTDDTAANAPMNTVDTNDLASGTYPVDRGPGKVEGKQFQHRVTLPSEPAPKETAPGVGEAEITASALRIREAPNTSSRVLGQYARGTKIQVLSQEVGEVINGNDKWNKTDQGYVSDAYCSRAP